MRVSLFFVPLLLVGIQPSAIAQEHGGLRLKDVIGHWQVQMRVVRSTCRNVQAGDLKTEQWQINQIGGQVKAIVVGGDNDDSEYTGGISRQGTLELYGWKTNHTAAIDLHGSSGSLSGLRVIGNSGPPNPRVPSLGYAVCVAWYHVELSR